MLCNRNEHSAVAQCTSKINTHFKIKQGLPWWSSGYESALQCRAHKFYPRSGSLDPPCHRAPTEPTSSRTLVLQGESHASHAVKTPPAAAHIRNPRCHSWACETLCSQQNKPWPKEQQSLLRPRTRSPASWCSSPPV